jgi:beta-mannanase
MRKTAYRIGFTLGALVLGVLIIVVFTFLGKKSSGPIEDFFTQMGSTVVDLENDYLLSQREPVRTKKLEWFDKYRNHKENLQNPDTIFLGVFDNNYQKSFDHILSLEDSIQTNFSLIQIYIAWGDKPKQRFPLKYAKTIYNLGSTPFITWEPWLNDFDRDERGLPPKKDPNKNGLQDIVNGDFDSYIDKWATDLKGFGKTVFIRLGHEMNDPYRYPWGPQNNKPADFISAWQYIVDYFRKQGVNNVVWVWSPHPAYYQYGEYYPGDDYVDWVGVGALNYGTVALWSQWWSFEDIFGNYYNWLASFNKPIVVTEFGSLSVGGRREEWYAGALTDISEKYPTLKAILFFNNNKDNTTLSKTLDWSLNNDSLSIEAVRKSITDW